MTDNPAYADLLFRVYHAFEMMPALHGAIPASADEVRAEVNAALDTFWDELVVVMALIHREMT